MVLKYDIVMYLFYNISPLNYFKRRVPSLIFRKPNSGRIDFSRWAPFRYEYKYIKLVKT